MTLGGGMGLILTIRKASEKLTLAKKLMEWETEPGGYLGQECSRWGVGDHKWKALREEQAQGIELRVLGY